MKCGSDSSPQTSYSPSFHLEQTRCESNAQNSYPTKIKCQKKKEIWRDVINLIQTFSLALNNWMVQIWEWC